jgi:undecaprenyl-diphosphatase
MKTRYWVFIIGTIIITTIVAWMSVYVMDNTPIPLEVQFSQSIQAIDAIWLPYLMALISVAGYAPWGPILVALFALILWQRINLWTGIFYLIVSASQGALNVLIKNIIMRPRPSEPMVRVMQSTDGYAYPSGHVMFYTVCFGLLIFLALRHRQYSFWRKIGVALVLVHIALIGGSRIYLGAHWLSDVLAAYLIGAVLLVWSIEIYRFAATRFISRKSSE